MDAELSHGDCLALLANPSTQNILEKLGYEYSDRGLSEFRKTRPNIVPTLIAAILAELELHPVFPLSSRDRLPDCGKYITKTGNNFVLMDIDKPSVWVEYVFVTPEEAAHGYIRKVLDPYWLQSDLSSDIPPKSVRRSWEIDRT
jgi:hypothetical protein